MIGLDGGGTKTMAIAASEDGRVLGRASSGPTNPNSATENQLFKELNDVFNQLKHQLQVPDWKGLSTVFAGIAGTANKKNRDRVIPLLKSLLPDHVGLVVEPDTVNALYSGTYGKPGIVHIAGTGSITYGINSQGVHGRVGGWGYLLGDEGSGFDIGRRGFIAALRGFDGRGPHTCLLALIQEHFSISAPREMIDRVYSAEVPKNELAALSKLVLQAERQGDAVAREIVDHAIREVSLSIKTLYSSLFGHTEEVQVILCGGIFSEEAMVNGVKAELEESENLSICLPVIPPVGGSIIGALEAGTQAVIAKNIIENIIKTI